jgi:hypothetical protein
VTEIIFEVFEDEVDGGYTASAFGYGIHTQGETLGELRAMVYDAVKPHVDWPGLPGLKPRPTDESLKQTPYLRVEKGGFVQL